MQNPLSHQLLTTGMNDIHVKPDEDNHFVWMVYDAEGGGGGASATQWFKRSYDAWSI